MVSDYYTIQLLSLLCLYAIPRFFYIFFYNIWNGKLNKRKLNKMKCWLIKLNNITSINYSLVRFYFYFVCWCLCVFVFVFVWVFSYMCLNGYNIYLYRRKLNLFDNRMECTTYLHVIVKKISISWTMLQVLRNINSPNY